MYVPSGSNGIENNMGHAPTDGIEGLLPFYSFWRQCTPHQNMRGQRNEA